MTDFVISSGQTSGFTLSGGDTLTVLAGGTSSNTSATAIGNEIAVSAGGVEILTSVDSGAADFVYGSAAATLVSGGDMFVSAGGVATGTIITGGGLDVVFAGGVESSTTVEQAGGGGSIIVFGTDVAADIGNGSSTVSAGGVLISATVFDAILNIAAGGAASGTQLQLGVENVAGSDTGAVLSTPGASLNVLAGGVASNTTVSGTLTVSANGQSISAGIDSGGVETVFGSAVATTVSGGDVFISAGGSATGTIITGRGLDVVFAGGVESGTTVQQVGGGGSIIVFGTDVAADIGNGSSTVSAGGVLISATLFDAILNIAAGGAASGTQLQLGVENVAGTDTGAVLSSPGASQIVLSGGVAFNTTDHGMLTVSAGGRTLSASVLSGGIESVYGAASNTMVSGGDLFLSAGGSASGVLITGSGLDVVFAGAVEVGAVIEQPEGGGRIIDYGTDIASIITNQTETVMSGGIALGATVDDGGLIVSAGGVAAGTRVLVGTEMVLGTEYGAQLTDGGSVQMVSAGGVAFNTVDAGQLAVSLAGTSIDATVLAGGVESDTGVASSTTVTGGDLFVSAGGVAYSPLLTAGLIVAFTGGAVEGATILGGTEIVSGTDLASRVGSGILAIGAGGAAQGETVDSGGLMIVSASGSIGPLVSGGPAGGVLIAGGQLDLQSGAVDNGAFIGFGSATGGDLKLDGALAAGTLLQGAVVSGFVPGDTIDLAGIAYSGGGTVTLGADNVLQVTENGSTYSINLDPTQSFANDTFQLSQDSAGGTLIGAVGNYAIADPLMTNNASGALYYDQVIGGQAAYTAIGGLGPEWEFDGAGNFSGAGSPGFLIRDTGPDEPGAVFLGQVANGTASFTPIGGLGLEWQFEGSADFLGTGQSEFLIRNTGTTEPGTLDLGQVVGGSSGPSISYTPLGGLGLEWQFEGTGDFLNDGNQAFLLRNTGTAEPGIVDVGEIANGAVQYTQVGGLGTEWDFEGTGNFFGGSGPTDVLLWNSGTTEPGVLAIGQVSSGQLTFTDIGGVGSEWQFVGTGNYLGNNKTDFLMRDTGNGALVVGSVFGVAGNASVQFTTIGGLGSEWAFQNTNPAIRS